MKTFKQFREYLQEALDKPYEHEEMGSMENPSGEREYWHRFKDPKGVPTHVYITHHDAGNEFGDGSASVDFTDELGKFGATGRGTIRHISTIKKIMQDHAKKHPHLKTYTFTGAKQRYKPGEGGRNRLYTRLAKMAGGRSDDGGAYSNRHFIPVNRG